MIHYEIAGEGLPIFLLHGIGSNSKSWRRQIAAFSPKLKVIAWDAPGFGKSDDPDSLAEPSIRIYAESLRDLMDTLGTESAILLGHALGGVIAQEFYRLYPARVRALILADTTQGGGGDSPDLRESKLANRLKLIRTMTPQQLAHDRAPTKLSKDARRELISEATAAMALVRPSGYEFAAKAMSVTDTRRVLDNIKVPLLLIWGAEDKATRVWKAFPEGAQIKIMPDAGHLCFMEQPDAFNSIVMNFLNGL